MPSVGGEADLADEDGGGDDGGPERLFIADGGLGYVLRAHNLVGEPVNFLVLVPALVGVEFETKRGGQHFSRELFRVIAGRVFVFPEAVMLREVPVELVVSGNGHADGGRNEAVRLTRRSLGHYDERDLAGLEALDPFAPGEDATAGREDARDPHEIARGDAGGPQRKFERRELFAMFAHTFGEEHLFGN